MRVFSLFIFYSNPLLSFQDHARQCGRVVFTDVFSSGSGKYVGVHSLLNDHFYSISRRSQRFQR